MPEPVRVFISHSSIDADLTRALCSQLAAPDDSKGCACEPLVDYTALKPGVEWPLYLHEMMAECQAAVVLITEHAVVSPWVLKEATILTWRRSLDPDFTLFVARDPAVVSDARLDAERFGPLLLPSIQQLPVTDAGLVSGAVRSRLKALAPPATPFDSVLSPVRDLVAQVARSAETSIQNVADKLGVAAGGWRPKVTPNDARNYAIATKLVCGRLGQYKSVDELFGELAQTAPPANVLEQLLNVVGPHWLDAEAAGRLPLMLAGGARRAAILNGAFVNDFTAAMFMRRAHPLSLRHSLIPTAGGSSGAIVADVTAQICEHMRARDGWTGTDAAIVEELALAEALRYVLIPEPPPDQASLDALTARFPTLVFLLSTGPELDRTLNLTAVEWLLPPVNIATERRERSNFRNARNVVKRLTHVG